MAAKHPTSPTARSFHQWKTYPTKDDIRQHIDAFITSLSVADMKTAFTLCPAITWDEGADELADPTDEGFIQEFVGHALFGAIEGQEVIEELEDEIDPDDPATWCKHLTPPSKVNYQDLALEVPSAGEGEVLANVHLNGECTDITGRYQLLQRNSGWLLAFSGFDVM